MEKRSEIWSPGFAMIKEVSIHCPMFLIKIFVHLFLKLKTKNIWAKTFQTKIDSQSLFDSRCKSRREHENQTSSSSLWTRQKF